MNISMIQNAIERRDPVLAREALAQIDLLLASTSDPNERVYLLFSRSSCYGVLGDFEEARKQLSLALQERPHDPDTQLTFEFNRGILYQQEGNYHEALKSLDSALSNHRARLNQSNVRFIYEDIQQRRAFLSVTLSNFRDAIPLLREILSFDLEKEVKSDALFSLGRCYLELQEWDLARDFLLQARAIGVTGEREKKFHFYLGIADFYSGHPNAAKREFKICEEYAGEHDVPLPHVYEWLSSVSKQLGETAESQRYARLARRN